MSKYVGLKGMFGSIMAVGFASSAVSQGTIRNPIQKLSNSDLTPAQSQRLAAIRNLPTTQDLQLIRVDPKMIKDQPQFVVQLNPADPLKMHRFEGLVSDVQGDQAFTFTGEVVQEITGQVGQILQNVPRSTTLVVNGNSVFGSIQTPTALYRIRSLGGGAHAMFK